MKIQSFSVLFALALALAACKSEAPKETATGATPNAAGNVVKVDKVVFPDIGVSKDLPLNTSVAINVPTDQARRLTFQCGMGMYRSAVLVQ